MSDPQRAFTQTDRQLLEATKAEVAGLRTDLKLHEKLVELLAEVKALREEFVGMGEIEKRLTTTRDNLKELGKE